MDVRLWNSPDENKRGLQLRLSCEEAADPAPDLPRPAEHDVAEDPLTGDEVVEDLSPMRRALDHPDTDAPASDPAPR